MKTSVILDDELVGEVAKTSSLMGENQATVLRMAIRAGLPVIANCFQAPRPEGYFADAYAKMPQERIEFEEAMGRQPQFPRAMKIRQWEIWKTKPQGFETDHWFIILTAQERLDHERFTKINGLACFTLRGEPLKTDVRLNGADGFETATVCQCDLVYLLDKSKLHSALGSVSWERQQQIKNKLKEVFRL